MVVHCGSEVTEQLLSELRTSDGAGRFAGIFLVNDEIELFICACFI